MDQYRWTRMGDLFQRERQTPHCHAELGWAQLWGGDGGYNRPLAKGKTHCPRTVGPHPRRIKMTISDPVGFAPFERGQRTAVYGVYVARAAYTENSGSLLALPAAVKWGQGSIILAPSYPVDQNNPFNDPVFFNIITMKKDN